MLKKIIENRKFIQLIKIINTRKFGHAYRPDHKPL